MAVTNRKSREPSRSAIMSCARREVGPSAPAGTGTRAPSPRRRNLFSFSLFSPPLAAVRPRGLSAIPAALSSLALGALLLLASAPAAAQTVAADREALVALYDATGGANWTNSTNWKTAAPLGEWYGVTTDAADRVTRLSLGDNGLTGPIPEELGSLSNLEWLSLSRNELTGPIPEELGSLSNLEVLALGGNALTGPIPEELGSLSSLSLLALWRERS